MKRNQHYIKRLSRALYNECVKDKNTLKAIAMLIFLKERYKCSVINNFTYQKISDKTNLSVFVVKKRLSRLQELGLLKIENNKIILNKIRAAKSNVRLEKINIKKISSIEIGLRALYIVEVQNRKEYVKSAINLTDKVRNMHEYNKAKHIRKQVLRGSRVFKEDGISYNYLSERLHISKSTLSMAIKYGVSNRIFEKNRNFQLIKTFEVYRDAKSAYEYLKNDSPKLRIMGKSLYLVKANTYNIL